MTGRPPAFDHLNGTDHRKRRHEARHPPRLPHHHGDLWLREHLHHPQHGARRSADRRDLLRLPPLLHGQAADPGHRRPRGPLREAVRQAQRQRRPVVPPTAPVPPRVGRAPSSCPAPVPPSRGPLMSSSTDAGSGGASDRLSGLLAEHAARETELAAPAVHADASRARRLGRRYAQLAPLVETKRALDAVRDDLAAARELADEDASFAAEAAALEQRGPGLGERLRSLLVPEDPDDDKDVILEIKAGEGGAESALFAGDLLRMYLRYAERRGWSAEVIDAVDAELVGYKDVAVAIKARGDEGIWSRLKFEGGVHRVQRVPVTESQGRIHTSAAGVLVLPEAEDVDVTVDPGDLRIDVFRSSGPGGQSVNTTDSAVRITHLPSGIVVSCQNEKSQLQNKESALRVLRSRLLAAAREEAAATASDQRRSQVRTVDRSERVRTYNFPENRISDHRVGYKSHNLDAVLDGELDPVIDALTRAHTAELLAAGS